MPDKWTDDEIASRPSSLDGWSLEAGKLHREFRFANFVEAFGFMTRAAIEAESMNHHPEWFNVYSKVVVDLTTHEAGGVSELDFRLAEIMNSLVA